ncbi:diaminopimelate epimerase [Aureliella helgolandensis]|uniref:Diaminopimelate epimerase n=1 Tax=Aureliella helgolandensis TaxID=2527968 RepID=A0A518GEG3_9BACT|nr:diaminopimelate epimerase [Aureliella helgolandensis]QDV26991.1 Diaminopimelate epimerase [Aureliella helgolandensis]
MRFTKMHGAGNDYVYVNCFAEKLPEPAPELAIKVSDRRFGVGGDGLILIEPSDVADARMRMFNADGSEAEMCGNGIRCVAKFVHDHGICQRDSLRIETGNGVLELKLQINGEKAELITVDMGIPKLLPAEIPTTLSDKPLVNFPVEFGGMELRVTTVSMGNPHCVVFVPEATDALVLGLGPQIESDPRFPKRTNVEFVEIVSRTELKQRTWERGSGETWACGTGASAVCVAAVLTGQAEREVLIHLTGGDLRLRWDEATEHVFMTGGAVEVFQGVWPT